MAREGAPLIVIQANFIGAIEFDKQRLYFFAGLFESRIVFLTLGLLVLVMSLLNRWLSGRG